MQYEPFIADSQATFARRKNRKGYFARIALKIQYPSTSPGIDFCCSGRGFFSQGYLSDATSEGYDDWKAGAKADVEFALSIAKLSNCHVSIAKIEGLDVTDTNPTTVGAAAAFAIWSALGFEPSQEIIDELESIVFTSWERSHDEIPMFTDKF